MDESTRSGRDLDVRDCMGTHFLQYLHHDPVGPLSRDTGVFQYHLHDLGRHGVGHTPENLIDRPRQCPGECRSHDPATIVLLSKSQSQVVHVFPVSNLQATRESSLSHLSSMYIAHGPPLSVDE